MYASDIRAQLDRLHLERWEAEFVGLTTCQAYIRDLEKEIAWCREAWVAAAVTEIAAAQAELSGRLVG
jgi:hypothetical protein